MEKLSKLLKNPQILVWFICEEGVIIGIQNGKIVTLTKGMFACSMSYANFRIIDSSKDVKYSCLYENIDDDRFRTLMSPILPVLHKLRSLDKPNFLLPHKFFHKFKKLAKEISSIESYKSTLNDQYLICLLEYSSMLKKRDIILDITIDTIKKGYNGYRSTQAEAKSSLALLFEHFICAVEEYCHKERFLKFYASICNLSQHQLVESIKLFSGKTPNEWITLVIMEKIKEEIMTNTNSIEQISENFCFSSPSALFSFFKKHTGYSPKQYRKLYENGKLFLKNPDGITLEKER